METGEESSAYQ